MVISIIGYTDRRPVLYTLMKLCQKLGDTAVVTDDRHLARLIVGEELPYYQNTLVNVTDESIDEWLDTTEYNVEDFEYIIADGKLAANADAVIFCVGCVKTEDEQDEVEYLDEYISIGMCNAAKEKNRFKWTPATFENLERFEGVKQMVEIDSNLTRILATELAPKFNLTADQFRKVVKSK